jgi:hypothetical protein
MRPDRALLINLLANAARHSPRVPRQHCRPCAMATQQCCEYSMKDAASRPSIYRNWGNAFIASKKDVSAPQARRSEAGWGWLSAVALRWRMAAPADRKRGRARHDRYCVIAGSLCMRLGLRLQTRKRRAVATAHVACACSAHQGVMARYTVRRLQSQLSTCKL